MGAAVLWQMQMGMENWNTKNPCGRPWGLQKDGDLWEQFWAATLLRGPRTLKLTKVKGHTTLKDLVEGKITEEMREGNNCADKAADAGTKEGMPGLAQLANWLAARHKQHRAFMSRVHKMIIATLRT